MTFYKLSRTVVTLYGVVVAFGLLIGISSCTNKSKNDQATSQMNHQEAVQHDFAMPIQKAHNMEAWKKKGALQTDISLTLGTKVSLHATLMIQTNGPGIRLAMSDDTVAVFDGQHMWSMPNDSAVGPFQLKTWAYFLKAPYKFNDPGTHIAAQGQKQMKGQNYETAKLTFDPGTGDSPDDWFILYRDPDNNRLKAMSYIVTFGNTSVKQANKNPHGISYENFKPIDGVPIATRWEFWHWSKKNGFSDQAIGHAQLSNIHFVKSDHLFSRPDGAMKMKQ